MVSAWFRWLIGFVLVLGVVNVLLLFGDADCGDGGVHTR